MKLFDLHADIGYDVLHQSAFGHRDILRTRHLPLLRKGEVDTVCMASYFEGNETWEDMQKMILVLKKEISSCNEVILVTQAEDLHAAGVHALLSVEGMCGIKDHVEEKIDWLNDQGVKIASLCWNEENALATGTKGNVKRGLSELGKAAIKQMIKRNMIIDVSHANETTFWDIMEHSENGMVIATHSNARALCDHVRNLRDDQLHAIAERGGIVGVVSAPGFIHKEKAKQDAAHLVEHILYLRGLIGIQHIALGFDFMNFFDGYDQIHAKGLKDASQAQNIIIEMRTQGFTEDEIQAVAYDNANRLCKSFL